MGHSTIDSEQGHWLLAKMGKRVLRPGGRELTMKLINDLAIGKTDAVVEFAPGLGYTATVLLGRNPLSYTGIELNTEAASLLEQRFREPRCTIVNSSAAQTGLDSDSVSKVVGEAMLTMQPDHRKSEIMSEAYRILKPGGLYGIHELSLKPDDLGAETKKDVQRGLAQSIKVNARPLTKPEWCALLQDQGFRIRSVAENAMDLLKLKRMIADEGILRTLKIAFNVATHPKARRSILDMRRTFVRYQDHLSSIAIVAEKIA